MSKEYIDKNKTKRFLLCFDEARGAVNLIDQVLVEDVVEVVRCKNCKHFDTDAFNRTVCMRDFQTICVKDNDFCSYGERKEDNG
jgi:hypothetical protein